MTLRSMKALLSVNKQSCDFFQVEVGFSLAILPQPSVLDEERNNQLCVVELAEPNWIRPVGVVYRTDRMLSIAAKKFVQLLEQNQTAQ